MPTAGCNVIPAGDVLQYLRENIPEFDCAFIPETEDEKADPQILQNIHNAIKEVLI